MDDLPNLDEPAVEFLILADFVEAVHGKLYLMGGGWENLGIHDWDAPVQLQVAVSVLVPWNATNRPHVLTVDVETEDGEVLNSLDANIVAGRPPHIQHGTSQRTMLALKMPVILPGAGTFVVAARMNDGSGRRVTFSARGAHGGGPS